MLRGELYIADDPELFIDAERCDRLLRAYNATGATELDERRRLLESTLRESAAVRIGPVVKQPLSRWFTAWREAGFTHYLARHQNARYHPGQLREHTRPALRMDNDPYLLCCCGGVHCEQFTTALPTS